MLNKITDEDIIYENDLLEINQGIDEKYKMKIEIK